MPKPFAAFDIDGTIVRWQLYHAMGDALLRQGHIDSEAFEAVRQARMSWKRRDGQNSFKAYEQALVEVFEAALKGLPEHALEMAAQTVFSEHKEQVYAYTRELISDLKKQGYLLFAISGSPETVVKKVAEYYGFDDYAATHYPTKNGYYTGEKGVVLDRKPELLEQLIIKHGTDLGGSIAIGDSEGDISMLEMVEKPIAFNPSELLFEQAKLQHWPIVIERKNMIYKLHSEQGNYLLNV